MDPSRADVGESVQRRRSSSAGSSRVLSDLRASPRRTRFASRPTHPGRLRPAGTSRTRSGFPAGIVTRKTPAFAAFRRSARRAVLGRRVAIAASVAERTVQPSSTDTDRARTTRSAAMAVAAAPPLAHDVTSGDARRRSTSQVAEPGVPGRRRPSPSIRNRRARPGRPATAAAPELERDEVAGSARARIARCRSRGPERFAERSTRAGAACSRPAANVHCGPHTAATTCRSLWRRGSQCRRWSWRSSSDAHRFDCARLSA